MKYLDSLIKIILVSPVICSSAFAELGVCDFENFNANDLVQINQDIFRSGELYFCKERLSDNELNKQFLSNEVVEGGSQSISKGNTIQSFPLNVNSVSLAGFEVEDAINGKQMVATYPLSNNQAVGVFSFLNAIFPGQNCRRYFGRNQYARDKQYLRRNANSVFNISPQAIFQSNNNSNNIITEINNAVLTSTLGNTINAKVQLFHANQGQNEQYRGSDFWQYCRVSVGVRVLIDPATANLEKSGTYSFNISVNTL